MKAILAGILVVCVLVALVRWVLIAIGDAVSGLGDPGQDEAARRGDAREMAERKLGRSAADGTLSDREVTREIERWRDGR